MDILLVDDNPLMHQVLERFLASLGYSVTVAGRADEAIEHASQSVPALVLIDMYLPDRDGPDALRAIRELPGCANVPAIGMSGMSEQDVQALMTDDFSTFVTKPIDLDMLEATVRRYIGDAGATSTT